MTPDQINIAILLLEYAGCVQAENEQDALEKAKQTETFRRDDTSVVVSIEELKGAMK